MHNVKLTLTKLSSMSGSLFGRSSAVIYVHFNVFNVESVRAKWEAREARLVAQLQAAEKRVGLPSLPHAQGAPSESTAELPTPTRSLTVEVATPPQLMEPAVQGSPSSAAAQGSPSSGESGVSGGVHATVLSQALLAHQAPPLPVFSGEGDGIGGSFSKRHEQLEMVASMCHWSEQVKLVNIATRLKGEAYDFYRSCTSTQRASYPLLVEQLSKRFTPVQIQSVQSSLFHDRKQRQGETVDTFDQELRSLLRKAYPPAQSGSEEAETMGRAVLANQFLAGLYPELKGKLAGQEGTFDQLLARARFEEAKLRDFGGDSGRRSSVRSYGGQSDRQSSPRSFAQGSYRLSII